MEKRHSFFVGIVEGFLRGNLPILVIIGSLLAGVVALMITPREEEPQIVVPLADVMISYPGGSAEQVERLVAARLERMLSQIDGVEYTYSTSRAGAALVTVRFFVGEDREDSLLKLYNKLNQNMDQVTPGVAGWVVKPIEIDDVPIVSATLYSDHYDQDELYRLAEEVLVELQQVPDSARITIHGGQPREIQVYLDRERVAGYGLTLQQIHGALQAANMQRIAGDFEQANSVYQVQVGPLLETLGDIQGLMIGVIDDRPVYLRDVANIVDGPAERSVISRFSSGPADEAGIRKAAAVTIAVAKKKGSNAVWVSQAVQARIDFLKGRLIPDEVGVRITRDYGATANDKVNDLVGSLGLAILTVIGLLALTMSWREGLIVALAVPITYSLTLICNYLLGYTINRVTLFALILALGLLVDDPIAGVENIERHFRKRDKPRLQAVVEAMREIMAPILLSTLAIILAFMPMFFITGMMGPYMQPMAVNVPVTVMMSTVVALTVTPWLCSKLLKYGGHGNLAADSAVDDLHRTWLYRTYSGLVAPFVDSRRRSYIMLGVTGLLFCGALLLAGTGLVPLKMLPFDNKNEFQVLVDMPEGTTLETTDAVLSDVEAYLQRIPEVVDYTTIAGAASPMDFNGLVRHYYLREGQHVGDIRVNLLHRKNRKADSHSLILRIREDIAALASKHNASIKLIEIPPGPPVLSTLVAEVYGQSHHSYDEIIEAAQHVKSLMREEPGVVDLDSTIEADQQELYFRVDREKAARTGISVADIVQTVTLAMDGMSAGLLHDPREKNELPIVLRFPRHVRSSPERLKSIPVFTRGGQTVQLGELGAFENRVVDQSIHRKNQERLVYVTAEMAGIGPAYAVIGLNRALKENPIPEGFKVNWNGEGEWKITLKVFRDLGIAFSVALVGIYVLLVYQTGSFLLPVVIMLSIPLTLIGIMPGFWILNLLVNRPVGGFENPVFFTATAMIGMIALSGIVVRNAIVLIDFIGQARDQGKGLRDAILESGAVRMRPILLTACTTLLGAWPITFDPIFSGLAWSIIFGLLVSTLFTLVVVPVVYFLLFEKAETCFKAGEEEACER